MHNRAEHLLRLLLLLNVNMRKRHAGAQDAVLMEIVGQRVKYRFAVMPASAHQRHFAGKINALFDNAIAVARLRQLRGIPGA